MKLIKTICLEFREGKSDKVYEVDLCEVGPDRFVVNFRYGRRGSKLQSGSKTPVPVPRVKAETIFDGLVHEKVGKGYHEPGAAPASVAPARAGSSAGPGPAPADAAAGREQAILARLRGDRRFKTKWQPARVVWRAGELRLPAAEPWIWISLLGEKRLRQTESDLPAGRRDWAPWRLPEQTPGTGLSGAYQRLERWSAGPMFLAYSAAWALGRCGTAASIPKLQAFLDDPSKPEAARRICLESIRLLVTPEERAASARQVRNGLPAELARAAREGTAEDVLNRLRAFLNEADERALQAFLDVLPSLVNTRWLGPNALDQYLHKATNDPAFRARLRAWLDHGAEGSYRVLADLYWIDDERTRPALRAFLGSAPLGPNLFRFVRYLFKVAELRGDVEMLALLAHRFETTRASVEKWYAIFPLPLLPTRAGWDPLVVAAYTGPTRRKLRRRTWRILQDQGRVGSPDYVRLAEALLLRFTDADAGPVITGGERKKGGGKTGSAAIDRFGSFYVFNRILYWNSPRYGPARSGFFVLKGKNKPGEPAPATREEAFRELWDRAPEALLRLLEHSRCAPVHEFAARALRANPDFCRGLGLATVKALAGSVYEPTARLGFELAVERFDPARPDPELVLILADSTLAEARRQAATWAEAHWGALRRIADLVVGLVASPQAETRGFARDLLRRTSFTDAESEPLVARLVARLLALGAGEAENLLAGDVATTMLLAFRPVLRRIGEPVIRDLLAHPLPNVQLLAGDLILGHDTFGRQPPGDVLRALLASPHPVVRSVGVKILDQFDDAHLKDNLDVLIWLTRHALADLRENVRGTVRRLAGADREFGRRFGGKLVDSLLVPGAPEGVPSHTARVLREDLRPYLDLVPAETVIRLLQSRSRPAQEIGGLLLATNVDWETISVDQLVDLANNEILSVREAARQIARDHPERLAADLRTAYRLADAKWEDSRRFAFELFRDKLGAVEWPAEALVGLCDSIKPDVQRFGQEMIGRLFRDEQGEQYALELSEHPDAAMQAFAGQFLDRFAAEDPAHARRLRFFCTVVLSRVNKGRVAKERAFAFLEKVARSGAEGAGVVAEILARLSATSALGDKARALDLLTFIHETYPAIELPIRVRPAEVRHGV